ncbi:NUDIX domain-containing protein [Kitasatospora sp. NPDC056138]|uniref:NUDIX domain-containing protein n=1 Tax=Kitasatospora sp. NPDC056138 TaxID=3345724 RepID=UPI0035DCD066
MAWTRLDEGRLLATRTHGRDLFHLPGGKPEAGESHEQALGREIAEELGVTREAVAIRPALRSCKAPPQQQGPGRHLTARRRGPAQPRRRQRPVPYLHGPRRLRPSPPRRRAAPPSSSRGGTFRPVTDQRGRRRSEARS